MTRPVRPAAEDAAVRPAGGVRRRRHRVPDRCAPLLDHLQPVDDGPAVLRDPQQPGPGNAGVRREAEARPGQGDAWSTEPATADGAPTAAVRSRPRPNRASSPSASPKQQRKRSAAGPRARGPAERSDDDRHEAEGTDRMSETEQSRRHRADRAERGRGDRRTDVADSRRDDRRRRTTRAGAEAGTLERPALEREGDIAADYLEELLDIADLDGDLDMDVEGDRAAVSIVGADLQPLVGRRTARCSRRCRS